MNGSSAADWTAPKQLQQKQLQQQQLQQQHEVESVPAHSIAPMHLQQQG